VEELVEDPDEPLVTSLLHDTVQVTTPRHNTANTQIPIILPLVSSLAIFKILMDNNKASPDD
jgi:hypothetical protein